MHMFYDTMHDNFGRSVTQVYDTLLSGAQRSRSARRRSKRFRARFLLRENGPALAQHTAETLLFFFLCLSECFRLPPPFAACALAACLLCGRGLFFPVSGILLSLGLRLLWGAEADLWQYIGLGLLLLLRLRPPRTVAAASAYTACALSLRLFSHILYPTTQEAVILCTVSLLVGVLCTPAVCQAMQLMEQRQARLRVDDLLCTAVLAMVVISGAGRVAIAQINLGFVLSGLAVLTAAAVGGCMAAVCTGLLGGVALALCGHTDGYVVCFTFSGVVCGLFYGRKRGVLGGVYLLCILFTSYAIRFRLDAAFTGAALLATVLFLMLPEKRITQVYTLARTLSPDAADNEAAYAQHMRAQWMGSISALAQRLPEVRLAQPEEAEALEDIVARLCEGCDRMPRCWQEEAESTRETLRRYFSEGDPTARMESCPRRDAWPALALESERARQQRLLRCAYAQREREATRTHLSAIAQAMNRISREGSLCDHDDELLRGEAEYVMRRLRVVGKILYALRVSRHIRVALRYEPTLTRETQIDRFCAALSQALGTPLHIAQRSKDIVLLEETAPMTVESYHLSASAGDGNGENGDSVLVRTASGGIEIAMLSDGMGHGSQAHTESRQTLELLSLCLDAGYTVTAALDAINCVMLGSTDGEQYATVDLCVADLWQNTATLNKLGACPSLLISGAALRTLESSALPLGILPSVEASGHTFAFGDGDMLLQFTDGLSDACGGLKALERQVELLMRDRLHLSPEAVCTALMSAAMRRCGGVPQDDMTVLCTLFRKRQAKRRERVSPPAC